MLIVAVSITSSENNDRKSVFEFSRPKQPITIKTTIGISLIFSGVNSIIIYFLSNFMVGGFAVKQVELFVDNRDMTRASTIQLIA